MLAGWHMRDPHGQPQLCQGGVSSARPNQPFRPSGKLAKILTHSVLRADDERRDSIRKAQTHVHELMSLFDAQSRADQQQGWPHGSGIGSAASGVEIYALRVRSGLSRPAGLTELGVKTSLIDAYVSRNLK